LSFVQCSTANAESPKSVDFALIQQSQRLDLNQHPADKSLKHFFSVDLSSPKSVFAPGDVKAGMLEDARSVAIALLSLQLTAFFTSAPILAS
jgi:hypothetical protein